MGSLISNGALIKSKLVRAVFLDSLELSRDLKLHMRIVFVGRAAPVKSSEYFERLAHRRMDALVAIFFDTRLEGKRLLDTSGVFCSDGKQVIANRRNPDLFKL